MSAIAVSIEYPISRSDSISGKGDGAKLKYLSFSILKLPTSLRNTLLLLIKQKPRALYPRNGVVFSFTPRLPPLSAVDETICFLVDCAISLNRLKKIHLETEMSRDFTENVKSK